jgi:hypothetical protein
MKPATAFVPAGEGTDKQGAPFTYGGYEVLLRECDTCGGTYSDSDQHLGAPSHKNPPTTK